MSRRCPRTGKGPLPNVLRRWSQSDEVEDLQEDREQWKSSVAPSFSVSACRVRILFVTRAIPISLRPLGPLPFELWKRSHPSRVRCCLRIVAWSQHRTIEQRLVEAHRAARRSWHCGGASLGIPLPRRVPRVPSAGPGQLARSTLGFRPTPKHDLVAPSSVRDDDAHPASHRRRRRERGSAGEGKAGCLPGADWPAREAEVAT